MELNVYTVYNRIDGSSDQLFLARTDARIASDITNSINAQNEQYKAKNYPLVDFNNLEIRRIGIFDDTTSVITPVPVSIVPFNT